MVVVVVKVVSSSTSSSSSFKYTDYSVSRGFSVTTYICNEYLTNVSSVYIVLAQETLCPCSEVIVNISRKQPFILICHISPWAALQ